MPDAEREQSPLADSPRYGEIRVLDRRGPVVVCLAQDRCTNERVAVKLYPRDDVDADEMIRDLLEYKNLLNQHVVRVRDVFHTRQYLAVVTEYAGGGSLRDCLLRRRRVSEDFARCIFQQLILALDYCHQMGLENSDIKVRSLLFMDDSPWPLVKLSAFGHTSRVIRDPSVRPSVKSALQYMAPEMLLQTGDGCISGAKAELWRCGVVLYTMMVGHHPFDRPEYGRDIKDVVECIMAARYSVPRGIMSADCEDMIRRLLVADPFKRACIEEVQSHIWFQRLLPDGALLLNMELRTQPKVQSNEEILSLLAESDVAND